MKQRRLSRGSAQAGFTLIELLVVIPKYGKKQANTAKVRHARGLETGTRLGVERILTFNH